MDNIANFPEDAKDKLRTLFPSKEIHSIQSVTGGNVHRVFSIQMTDGVIMYLKKRESSFAHIQLESNPEDIRFEHKALDSFEGIAGSIIPSIIHYSSDQCYLILSDVMPDNPNAEILFQEQKVTCAMIQSFAKSLADLHNGLERLDSTVRDNEDEYYHHNLSYRIGFIDHHAAQKLLANMSILPRQLIFGDVSPKNISFTNENELRICDLETAHIGNRIFDVGFAIGHIALHRLHNEEPLYPDIELFIHTYMQGNTLTAAEIDCIAPIILTTIWFRIDSPLVPYSISFSEEVKKRLLEYLSKNLDNVSDLQTTISNLGKAYFNH